MICHGSSELSFPCVSTAPRYRATVKPSENALDTPPGPRTARVRRGSVATAPLAKPPSMGGLSQPVPVHILRDRSGRPPAVSASYGPIPRYSRNSPIPTGFGPRSSRKADPERASDRPERSRSAQGTEACGYGTRFCRAFAAKDGQCPASEAEAQRRRASQKFLSFPSVMFGPRMLGARRTRRPAPERIYARVFPAARPQ